jgi:hypothetical protein
MLQRLACGAACHAVLLVREPPDVLVELMGCRSMREAHLRACNAAWLASEVFTAYQRG